MQRNLTTPIVVVEAAPSAVKVSHKQQPPPINSDAHIENFTSSPSTYIRSNAVNKDVTKKSEITLKGVTRKDLRALFDGCLTELIEDRKGSLCADVAALERACRWSVNAHELAEVLAGLRNTGVHYVVCSHSFCVLTRMS
jgi:hypothetical protein